MSLFLTRLVATFAAFCGVLFIYGFLMVERIKISSGDDERKRFNVMITLPRVEGDPEWVKVFLCSAEILEDSGTRCIRDGWDTSSTQPFYAAQRQYEFPWGRYVPRGPLEIHAILADANWQVLARGRAVVMR